MTHGAGTNTRFKSCRKSLDPNNWAWNRMKALMIGLNKCPSTRIEHVLFEQVQSTVLLYEISHLESYRSHLKGLCNSFRRTSKGIFAVASLMCRSNLICASRQIINELGRRWRAVCFRSDAIACWRGVGNPVFPMHDCSFVAEDNQPHEDMCQVRKYTANRQQHVIRVFCM